MVPNSRNISPSPPPSFLPTLPIAHHKNEHPQSVNTDSPRLELRRNACAELFKAAQAGSQKSLMLALENEELVEKEKLSEKKRIKAETLSLNLRREKGLLVLENATLKARIALLEGEMEEEGKSLRYAKLTRCYQEQLEYLSNQVQKLEPYRKLYEKELKNKSS